MTTVKLLAHRWIRRWLVPFAIATAAGLGVATALWLDRGSGSAYDWPRAFESAVPQPILKGVDIGEYTYEDEGTCLSAKDPINLIFSGSSGFPNDVDAHALRSDHGGWTDHPGTVQYFRDHGLCQPMDNANADGGPEAGRFHMRYNQGLGFDPDWKFYTVANAHHEDYVLWSPWNFNCGPPGGHAVDGNENEPPGGYNKGRAEIWWNWTVLANDPHVKIWQENWGNTDQFEQCDGDKAWSNGWVYWISMEHPLNTGGFGPGGGGGQGKAFSG